MSIKLPSYAEKLFQPKRYKVLLGGRGSGKSISIARYLLILATTKKIRVLCAREFQNSITESVHHLLLEQAEMMGIVDFFEFTNNSITGKNGSEFIFKGVRMNIASIKSMAGITHLWLEEAHTISQMSWDVLIPTIREPNSEIIVTFNPDSDDDPTYRMFVNPDGTPKDRDDALIIRANWNDNPFFPEVLRKEKDFLYATNPELAEHVWGGQCRRNSDIQIFKNKWVVRAFEPQKDWDGPYFGCDWGFACLGGDSLIKTKYGNKKIKDIVVGDEVLTRDGFKKVLHHMSKGIKDVVELDCGYEKPLVITTDHRIFTDDGWKRVDELKEFETICVIKLNLMEKFLNAIRMVSIPITTILQKIRKSLYYIEKYGKAFLVKLKVDSLFTTLMETHSIMILKTLHAYLRRSIQKYITMSVAVFCQKMKCKKSEQSMDTQKRIGNTDERNPLRQQENVINIVKNAAKKSKLLMSIKNIAIQIVEKNQTLGIVRSNILAKFAKLNLWRRLIAKENHAHLNARISYRTKTEKCEVFDIFVENREFFANGILVHNCDPTVLVKVYLDKTNREVLIRHAKFGYGIELDYLADLFDQVPESRRFKIRADSARPETISFLKRKGFNIEGVEKWKGSVEDGIEFLRTWNNIVIHPDCEGKVQKERDFVNYGLITEFKNYSYKTDRLTGDVLTDIIDAYNHGIDACRYSLSPLIKGTTSVFDSYKK